MMTLRYVENTYPLDLKKFSSRTAAPGRNKSHWTDRELFGRRKFCCICAKKDHSSCKSCVCHVCYRIPPVTALRPGRRLLQGYFPHYSKTAPPPPRRHRTDSQHSVDKLRPLSQIVPLLIHLQYHAHLPKTLPQRRGSQVR